MWVRGVEMIMRIVATVAILLGVSLLSGCQHNLTSHSAVITTPKKIDSSESALQVATAYLDKQKIDLSRHDMSKPEAIQELESQGRKTWRVSWKLENFTGKGGQLVVVVDESGKCDQGWGE